MGNGCKTCGKGGVKEPSFLLRRMNSNLTVNAYKELKIIDDPLINKLNKKDYQIGIYFLEKRILKDRK
jgi:hypothetical protein